MRNTFLLEELIIEGRLEDVKKKYPKVPPEIIDSLSKADPSGNNKYLEWMTNIKFKFTVPTEVVIRMINLFHKNLNKLTKENIDEYIKEKKREWLLTDNSPVAKTFQKIYKSPKDINQYDDWGLFQEILGFIDELLTKSDVKKLETNTLYNDDDLLILIPLSHKASCFYGSGTKWCTTNKNSDNYFKSYSSRGTLFYIINKKLPKSDNWYKAAIFINNEGTEATAYDAPDSPTDISVAKDKIQHWDTVRDVLVDYLVKNNKKGVDKLYFGGELLSWLTSLDLDPLQYIKPNDFIRQIGVKPAFEYLRKRGIAPLEFLPAGSVLWNYIDAVSNVSEAVRIIWDECEMLDKNPLLYFNSRELTSLLLKSITTTNDISVDEFLNVVLKYKINLATWFSDAHVQPVIDFIDKAFGEGEEGTMAFFNFLGQMDINPFNRERGISRPLIRTLLDKIPIERRIDLLLRNIEHLNVNIDYYGVDKEAIMAYCDDDEIKELISRDLISGISLDDIFEMFGQTKESYMLFVANAGGVSFKGLNGWLTDSHFVTEHLINRGIDKVFKNMSELQAYINELVGVYEDGDPKMDLFSEYDVFYVYRNFYNNNMYECYLDYKNAGKLDEFNDLQVIKAYEDANPDDKEIKERVKDIIESRLFGYTSGKIREEDGETYLVLGELCDLQDLYRNQQSVDAICNEDSVEWYTYDAEDAMSSILDIEGTSKLIRDYLMVDFREATITLDADYENEFESWIDGWDESGNDFYIKLYDERINGMSNHMLETIILRSSQLRSLRNTITWAYNDVVNNNVSSEIHKTVLNSISEIFGDRGKWSSITVKDRRSGEFVDRHMYTIKTPNLINDVIDYAKESFTYESELPSEYLDLIVNLMNEGVGRFDGKVSLDIDYTVETYYPYGDDIKDHLLDQLRDRLGDLEWENRS